MFSQTNSRGNFLASLLAMFTINLYAFWRCVENGFGKRLFLAPHSLSPIYTLTSFVIFFFVLKSRYCRQYSLTAHTHTPELLAVYACVYV